MRRRAESRPDQAELARLENALARAIGPIARRLVAEEAGRHGTISEIRQALAVQIENPKVREEFLSKPYTDATLTHRAPGHSSGCLRPRRARSAHPGARAVSRPHREGDGRPCCPFRPRR